MFTYHKLVLRRAWVDTFQFMGWDMKPPSIGRAVFLWIFTTVILSLFGKDYLPDRYAELGALIGAAGVLVIVSFMWHLLVTPSKIYQEQQTEILSLTEIKKNKAILKVIYETLQNLYKEGEIILTELKNLTTNQLLTTEKKDKWINDVESAMRNNSMSDGDIFSFLSPFAGSEGTANKFQTHLLVLQLIVTKYMSAYEQIPDLNDPKSGSAY